MFNNNGSVLYRLLDKEEVLKNLADAGLTTCLQTVFLGKKGGSNENVYYNAGTQILNKKWEDATKLLKEEKYFELYQLLGGKKTLETTPIEIPEISIHLESKVVEREVKEEEFTLVTKLVPIKKVRKFVAKKKVVKKKAAPKKAAKKLKVITLSKRNLILKAKIKRKR